MNRYKCFSLVLVGSVLLLICLVVACGKSDDKSNSEPEIQPESIIYIEQHQLSFVASAGDNTLSQPIEICISATNEPLLWSSEDDAPWLEVHPAKGIFDRGVSKAIVWVHTSGMNVGHHSATISIFVPEANNNPRTISVELDVETPEAPAIVAAREFWESSYYKPYWDWHAATDVIDVVESYRFPMPYIREAYNCWQAIDWSQRVEIKGLDFEYNPEIHERPFARVHCLITCSCQNDDEQDRRIEKWIADCFVVLEIEPEPYRIDYNEWKMIDFMLTLKSYQVGR